MTPTDPITAQVTAAAACAYLLKLVQRWKAIPWVTDHTEGLNIALRAALSGIATLGITWQWNATEHTLVIGGLTGATIMLGLWHWFGQFAIQHGFGQLLGIGTVKAVDNPVQINNGGK